MPRSARFHSSEFLKITEHFNLTCLFRFLWYRFHIQRLSDCGPILCLGSVCGGCGDPGAVFVRLVMVPGAGDCFSLVLGSENIRRLSSCSISGNFRNNFPRPKPTASPNASTERCEIILRLIRQKFIILGIYEA